MLQFLLPSITTAVARLVLLFFLPAFAVPSRRCFESMISKYSPVSKVELRISTIQVDVSFVFFVRETRELLLELDCPFALTGRIEAKAKRSIMIRLILIVFLN